MTKKDNQIFVEHILDSIGAIEKFAEGITEKELASDRLRRSAIVREIEVIGEAAKNMSREQLVDLKKMMDKVNSKLKPK